VCVQGAPPTSLELGARDGDTRLLRTRLPGVPFAGIRSDRQLGPLADRYVLTQHAIFAAVFTSPS